MAKHGKGAAKKRAETRLPPEEDPEFQIAPMIDILLVLLVFFMSISSTEVLQTNDAVHLPVAKDGEDVNPAKEGQMIVNILWNSLVGSAGVGTIDVDRVAYKNADELIPMLQKKMEVATATNTKFRILIRADKDVRYEYLRTVLKAAGASGVNNVTFSVVNKDKSAAPAPDPVAP